MKNADGEVGSSNCADEVEPPAGTVTTDQLPLPLAGKFAAMNAMEKLQTV